jgi:predicted negative regulator of RcsB-dependent stress response
MSAPDPLKLAESYMFAGELPDADAILSDYLATHPDADARDAALRLRASVRLHSGDLSGARADLDALAIQYDADHFQRSIIAERAGDLNAAIPSAMAAWEADNRYYWRAEAESTAFMARALERLIRLLFAAGRTIQADVMLSGSQYQTAGWLHLRGDIAAESGRDEDALTHYTGAWRALEGTGALIANQRAILQLKRARLLRRLRRYADARIALDAAAPLDDPAIRFERGLLHADTHPDDLAGAARDCAAGLAAASAALTAVLREELDDPRYADVAARL